MQCLSGLPKKTVGADALECYVTVTNYAGWLAQPGELA
jgi:hypothetical protein